VPNGRLLVVTAVEVERNAVLAGAPDAEVIAAGLGSAASAAGTARALALAEAAGRPYSAVLSTGIGGGFSARTRVGGLVVADRSIAADLGADSAEGFIGLDDLGFGTAVAQVDPGVLKELRDALPGATVGAVLTVATVTGTAAGAYALLARHPDAAAEAMEGFGVATAAAQAGVAFAELRAISNPVGPRDRGAGRIADALQTLTNAFAALGWDR
jgi:futalosine hydrolase